MAYLPVLNQSASGTVGASIIGLPPVSVTNTPSISGTVQIGNFPTTQNVSGSVVATQGTNPWIITGSVQTTVSAGNSSVQVLNFPANQSVSGAVSVSNFPGITSLVSTIPSSVIVGASIFGLPPVNVTNTNLNVGGSVVAFQGSGWSGSVAATVTNNPIFLQLAGSVLATSATVNPAANQSVSGTVQVDVRNSVAVAIISGSIAATFTPPANQSVSGTVQADVRGSVATVIIGGSVATATTNSSVMLLNGANTIGSVTTLQGTNPWVITSSIAGGLFPISGSVAATITNTNVNVGGSVVAFQGAGWSGSVAAVITNTNLNVGGSVVAFQAGTRTTSIVSTIPSSVLVGNYAQRNDSLSSFLGANLTRIPQISDSAGRTVIKPFSPEDGTIISYQGSVVSTSVTLIQASATGLRSYITDFWVSNTGNSTTLVTFQDGSTSIIGYTIAPNGGGSNSPGIAIPLKTAPSQDLAFKATTATSILYLTLKGYQAP